MQAREKRGRPVKWDIPFDKMEEGDWFYIPREVWEGIGMNHSKMRAIVWAIAKRYGVRVSSTLNGQYTQRPEGMTIALVKKRSAN